MNIEKLWQDERVRFLCACFVGFCVHYGSVNALTLLAGWWHMPAALISLIVGYSVTFILQKYWTFESNGNARDGQVWQYIKVSVAFYAANAALLFLLVDLWGMPYWAAQPPISIFLTVASFGFERPVFT